MSHRKMRRTPAQLDADRALFESAVDQLDEGGISEAQRGKIESAGQLPPYPARFARRVARGEVEPAFTVDLHGLDRGAAVDRLRSSLREQRRSGVTIVLVVHGKGRRVLAGAVRRELDRHPAVAEHLAAPGRFGGAGARLVRLKSGF